MVENMRIGVLTTPENVDWFERTIPARYVCEYETDAGRGVSEALEGWQRTNTLVAVVDDDVLFGRAEKEEDLVKWLSSPREPKQRVVFFSDGRRHSDDPLIYRLVSGCGVKDVVLTNITGDPEGSLVKRIASPGSDIDVSCWKTDDPKLLAPSRPERKGGLLGRMAEKKAEKRRAGIIEHLRRADPGIKPVEDDPEAADEARMRIAGEDPKTRKDEEAADVAKAKRPDTDKPKGPERAARGKEAPKKGAEKAPAKEPAASGKKGAASADAAPASRPNPAPRTQGAARPVAEASPVTVPDAQELSEKVILAVTAAMESAVASGVAKGFAGMMSAPSAAPALEAPAPVPELRAITCSDARPTARVVVYIAGLRHGIGTTHTAISWALSYAEQGVRTSMAIASRRTFNELRRAAGDEARPAGGLGFSLQGVDFYHWADQRGAGVSYDLCVCDCGVFTPDAASEPTNLFVQGRYSFLIVPSAFWEGSILPDFLNQVDGDKTKEWRFLANTDDEEWLDNASAALTEYYSQFCNWKKRVVGLRWEPNLLQGEVDSCLEHYAAVLDRVNGGLKARAPRPRREPRA